MYEIVFCLHGDESATNLNLGKDDVICRCNFVGDNPRPIRITLVQVQGVIECGHESCKTDQAPRDQKDLLVRYAEG